MKGFRIIAAALAVAFAAPIGAHAQVVREDGAKSIAGVLYPQQYPGGSAAEWTFKSAGGEILFASLDADIYRKSPQGSDHGVTAAADTGGGDDHDGGPGLFKLTVLDAYERVVGTCESTRPAPPPGWQRDPRLACAMPAMRSPATYKVRVALANPHGETGQTAYPFLLNISLRKIAKSGTPIQSAIAASSAGGF